MALKGAAVALAIAMAAPVALLYLPENHYQMRFEELISPFYNVHRSYLQTFEELQQGCIALYTPSVAGLTFTGSWVVVNPITTEMPRNYTLLPSSPTYTGLTANLQSAELEPLRVGRFFPTHDEKRMSLHSLDVIAVESYKQACTVTILGEWPTFNLKAMNWNKKEVKLEKGRRELKRVVFDDEDGWQNLTSVRFETHCEGSKDKLDRVAMDNLNYTLWWNGWPGQYKKSERPGKPNYL